ncbi:MAG TPA: cbb3-type cytochrome c oxidase subunit I [Burkholderiales bacterium]|nr:cbb3-type cytochrome c oxidase subunit I [Burkholderiales bacterium]
MSAARGLADAASPIHARPETARYRIAVSVDARSHLATGWLLLGMGALVASGLFSLLLVLARTPGVNKLVPVADLFHVSLVVHVDLSVLVWFAAFAGLLWAFAGSSRKPGMGWSALALCSAGTLLMVAAPFAQSASPIMSNYIPVLDGSLFLSGLTIFGAGLALEVIRTLIYAEPLGLELDGASALRLGLLAAAVCTAVALFAFWWSWRALPWGLEGKVYYELLFWGGGHVLQFTWTLLMLVAWLWLATAIGATVPLSPRVSLLLFGLALVLVFCTPFVYLIYDVTSIEHRRLLTWMMRVGGGLAILPVSLAVVLALWERGKVHPEVRPLRAALIMSLVLFAVGGLMGFAIKGSDVRIPAHYHGCIVGVTLAFMGLAYHLLPHLGFGTPTPRLAVLQPYVYGIGQLLHITGLVWSGGYGVQRKVAGAEQVLGSVQELAGMALMGLGGLIAIAGGLLFVIAVIGALRSGRRKVHAYYGR